MVAFYRGRRDVCSPRGAREINLRQTLIQRAGASMLDQTRDVGLLWTRMETDMKFH